MTYQDWYKAENSYEEYRCPYINACLTSPEVRLLDVSQKNSSLFYSIPATAGFDFMDSSEANCAKGTSGTLCAVCGDGEFAGR
jgi:hypothetical protein